MHSRLLRAYHCSGESLANFPSLCKLFDELSNECVCVNTMNSSVSVPAVLDEVSATNSASENTTNTTTTTNCDVNDVMNTVVDEREIDVQPHQSPSTIHSIPSPVVITTTTTTTTNKTMNKSISNANAKITSTTSMRKQPIKKVVTATATATSRKGSRSTVSQSVIKTRTTTVDKKNTTKPSIAKSVKTITNDRNHVTVSKTNDNVKDSTNQGVKGKEKKKLSQHLIRPKFGPSSRQVKSSTTNHVNTNHPTNSDPIEKREEREMSRTMEQFTGKNRNDNENYLSIFHSYVETKHPTEDPVLSDDQPLDISFNPVHSVHSVHSEEFMDFDELLAKLGDDDQIVNQVIPNDVSTCNDNDNDNIKMVTQDNHSDEFAKEVDVEEEEGEGEGERRLSVRYGVVSNADKFFEESDGDENGDGDNDGLISGLNRYV